MNVNVTMSQRKPALMTPKIIICMINASESNDVNGSQGILLILRVNDLEFIEKDEEFDVTSKYSIRT